jgi:NADH-quinone oxidoreductase subunit H
MFMEGNVYWIWIVLGVLVVVLSLAAGLIWYERRLLGWAQDRQGPNRVGPLGLMQPLADVIKIFFKEDWIPPFTNRVIFVVAHDNHVYHSDEFCRNSI